MKKLKKLLTVFLSVLMMLGTLTTVTGATEIQKADDRLSDAEVAAIIEEAFPEHNMATAKAKNSVSAWESTEDKTLVQNETRKLSNDIEVTYLKYSNDTSAYIINTCNFYTNSTSSGNGYTRTNTDIILTVPGYSGTMYVSALDYTIYTSSYDKINSKGSVSDPNGSTGQTVVERWQENSSGPATVRYSVPFEQPLLGGSITVTLKVYIGNNQRTYDVF